VFSQFFNINDQARFQNDLLLKEMLKVENHPEPPVSASNELLCSNRVFCIGILLLAIPVPTPNDTSSSMDLGIFRKNSYQAAHKRIAICNLDACSFLQAARFQKTSEIFHLMISSKFQQIVDVHTHGISLAKQLRQFGYLLRSYEREH
jgi:hypothetical protein